MKNHVLLIAALTFPVTGLAAPGMHDTAGSHGMQVAQASSELSDGEVRKVDKDAQKMTIKHGPLKNLDMPPMTMVFRVKDPAMLDKVKAGDKIKFRAEQTGGAFVVTQVEAAK